MDMPLTACLTVTLSVFAVAAARHDLARWRLWLAYASLGLAALAKGPLALALAAGIAILFWCFDERGGSLHLWRPISGLFITTAVALPWYWFAFRQNGFSFISVFFINHNVARLVSDIHHHSQPFYYYLPVLLGMLFPWSGWLLVLAPGSPRDALRRWKEWSPATLFLICWIVFPFLFFSFSVSKLAGYMLPILPPLALLLGARFADWWESPGKAAKRGAEWLFLAFTVLLAAAAPVAFDRVLDGQWKAGLWIACATIVPGSVAFLCACRGRWKQAFVATVAQAVILVITVAVAAYPALGNHYSTRDLAFAALRLREPGESITTYRFFHHTLYYYTDYQISAEFQDSATLERFMADHRQTLLVTEAGRIPELESIKDLSITVLCSQSNFRLLRVQGPRSKVKSLVSQV
jgi:4-amino-4-deoxy-L-arabinose transferase-like glycosyltransferase